MTKLTFHIQVWYYNHGINTRLDLVQYSSHGLNTRLARYLDTHSKVIFILPHLTLLCSSLAQDVLPKWSFIISDKSWHLI